MAETGVHSMLSLRLFLGEDALGALTLYSHSVDVFDDRAQAFGQVLAAHAAIAMSAADDHEEVEHLEEALSSSRVIGTAQGILMVQVKVDRAQAFRILVQGSQRLNIKLRALAARIVSAEEEHHRGAPTASEGARGRGKPSVPPRLTGVAVALAAAAARAQGRAATRSATVTSGPVKNGTSSRTCIRALDARSSRIRSTMRCSSSASNASTHS